MRCDYCGNDLTDEELVLGQYHEGCADAERRETAAKGGGGTYE